ncbi:MAG: hypothetical protein CMC37_02735 [Flavobacteriaceae bacterium]|nr:hypothetical protein [Flavobacteriaceae bacterium]|tara:strand:- start:26 stop:637 length:612 start_codon:yes stop_codon:yes gene_type:complete
MFTKNAIEIFNQATADFKKSGSINQLLTNRYNHKEEYIESLLYKKSWIDTIQWAYEDIIRDPEIDPIEALNLKRKIDSSNQERTDTVELLDEYFLKKYSDIKVLESATINTESPAWALDRLSILELKIYHMNIETNRLDASENHKSNCSLKLAVLIQQRDDLSTAIDELLDEISSGKKYMKTYKQMKMYNDQELNPILRKNKQ